MGFLKAHLSEFSVRENWFAEFIFLSFFIPACLNTYYKTCIMNTFNNTKALNGSLMEDAFGYLWKEMSARGRNDINTCICTACLCIQMKLRYSNHFLLKCKAKYMYFLEVLCDIWRLEEPLFPLSLKWRTLPKLV